MAVSAFLRSTSALPLTALQNSGAKASAIMYSMIETAKENGLDPFAYLVWVFHTAPGTGIRENPDALERILPFHAPLFCSAVKGKAAV